MGAHGKRLLNLSVRENNDRLADRPNDAPLPKRFGGYLRAGGQIDKLRQIDGLIFDTEQVLEAALMRESLDERKLAALETRARPRA